MKKRIVCVLLTLIMLMSLVPMTASAAGRSTSEAAITVLKQLNTFVGQCYQYNGSVYHIGYGTVCEGDHHFNLDGTPKGDIHTTTEAKADKALRNHLVEMDAKVNNFASANGLSLTQGQHDALVLFTFREGDAWMNGTGVLKNVVVGKGSATEMLNAMSLWTDGEGEMSRRKVEINMYFNGIYSNTVSTAFRTVTYYANGGTLAQGDGYSMYYDVTETVKNIPVPTRKGYKFIGWYTAAEHGEWVSSGVKEDAALYAVWQPIGSTPTALGNLTPVKYKLTKAQLATLNIYNMPSDTEKTSKVIDKVNDKSDLTVYRDFVDANGTRWGRLSNGGWVKTGARTGTAEDGTYVSFEVTVTVTNSYVNRRVNQTAFSAKNGSYSMGDQLLIINEDDGWGQVGEKDENGNITAVGWVALMYTNWDSVNGGATSSTNNSTPIATAVVTYNGYLNIRSGAGTDNKIVGALAKNDTASIYEIKTVNGHQWGRTESGWICLTYTKLTMKSGVSISDEGVKTYTFAGKAVMNVYPHVEAGYNTNTVDTQLTKDTAVTVTNLAFAEGDTWGKVTWYVDTDKDGKTDTAKSGWVVLSNPVALTKGSSPIELEPAKFLVACDSLNVRTGAGDGYELAFSLNKGVEMEVTQVYLVGENIWGLVTVKTTAASGATGEQTGYINLAAKYVSRSNFVTSGAEENTVEGLVATVVNTGSVNVRKYGATYGAKIDTLAGGTTVAVWEEKDGWYKVDSNQNGTYDYEGDGWVSGSYLNVYEGTTDGKETITGSNGESFTTDGTGTGVVANTYSGVNVRQGAGTGYAILGKLLPGTAVEILEVKTVGATKWGRTAEGWVSMDYIAMISYNESVNTPEGGITVDSFENVDKTTTTAVYTGWVAADATIYQNPVEKPEDIVRTAGTGENLTIHELAAVSTTVESDEEDFGDHTTTTTVTKTTYWARVNDGWIKDPELYLELNALDEKTHTQTGVEKLYIRTAPETGDVIDVLVKGEQVAVTALEIVKDKVWGRIETDEGTGWIRLDYMSEGAIYLGGNTNNNVNNSISNNVVMGNGSSTGGFVNNTSGYRYTGKVIRTNELSVRATASTSASKTTTLKNGQALVIYETTVAENMAWGRCDAGWVYLYYVDLVPATGGVDARVVYNDNTVIYSDMNCSSVAGTYAKMSVIDIYEIVGKMARTELGWVNTDNLL